MYLSDYSPHSPAPAKRRRLSTPPPLPSSPILPTPQHSPPIAAPASSSPLPAAGKKRPSPKEQKEKEGGAASKKKTNSTERLIATERLEGNDGKLNLFDVLACESGAACERMRCVLPLFLLFLFLLFLLFLLCLLLLLVPLTSSR
jgi:hypothetical protein